MPFDHNISKTSIEEDAIHFQSGQKKSNKNMCWCNTGDNAVFLMQRNPSTVAHLRVRVFFHDFTNSVFHHSDSTVPEFRSTCTIKM